MHSLALIQGETLRWHCAARREIAERSEEAPGAKAAQPSRNVGRWKALEGYPVGVGIYDKPGGVVRGECRGGLGGAAAPNRPPSAPAGGGPNTIKRKASVPAGHSNLLSKDKPCFAFLSAPVAPTPNTPPAGGGPNNIKEKAPCPQGTATSSQRTSPALLSPERPPRLPQTLHPPQAAQTTKKKSLRARRAHKPPLKGQALLHSLKEYQQRKPIHLPPAAGGPN